MSATARKMAQTMPAPAPVRHRPGTTQRARTTRAPAARPRTSTSPQQHRRARRGSLAFWVLTAIVVTAMVVGVVSLSALIVQASFRLDDLRGAMSDLSESQQVLTKEVAELSSPPRVMAWARDAGMVMPDDAPVVLRVRDRDGGSTVGETQA